MDVRVPPSLLTRTASNMSTSEPNVVLRPTCEGKNASVCTTDDKLDAVGGFTAHLNEVPGMEHVKRTASPGHATLVLYTREASVEMKNMLIA